MRFTMWSWFHIIYLISPFIFFLILFLLTKNKSTKQKRLIGIVLSIVAVVLLFLRNLEIYLENGLDAEIIPLQICHFANFIMLFAFIFNNKTYLLYPFASTYPPPSLRLFSLTV
ncbi:MAG: hypothetical protein RBS76_03565 [Acholeplasmatales bacterium]|nr:hypothetical protein [Acholeplasmataceae bacterium]MDY0115559.1 hypothetical protein [Acholeplasmatales bacterium]MCK9233736.1 hypothetical protein [Acholeplasmataceae bacterium]MCK9289018.1 hypothetical protein [Acholeplasmataceae bacterium]MCK9427713.1 hypothetical protein [Acholeplasmataceae bacterium]